MKTDREWAELIVDADIIGSGRRDEVVQIAETIVQQIRAETLAKLPTIEMGGGSEVSTPPRDSII